MYFYATLLIALDIYSDRCTIRLVIMTFCGNRDSSDREMAAFII